MPLRLPRLFVAIGVGLGALGCAQGESAAPAERGTTSAASDGDVLPFEAVRLDCAVGDATVWTTDPIEPPPGVTIEEALVRHKDEGAVVQERTDNRAVATVEDDGRVIKTLELTTWSKSNDSWFVESGATCRR